VGGGGKRGRRVERGRARKGWEGERGVIEVGGVERKKGGEGMRERG